MDVIKNWMPPVNWTMITNHLPQISTGPSVAAIVVDLKLRSAKLLGRISCNFFDRPSQSPGAQPACHQRQTIQTNYISTISSLVDKPPPVQPSSITNDPNVHTISIDAQSDNFGLYALKCNRKVPKVAPKKPPPIPPQPIRRQSSDRDGVHEQFQPIRTLEPPKEPLITTPRLHCKRRAPTPNEPHPLQRSTSTQCLHHKAAAMMLDTSFLHPLEENLNELPVIKSELYRIANMYTENNLNDASNVCVSLAQSSPQRDVAITVRNNNQHPINHRRKRLLKQFSTTESVNIFGNANQKGDAFDDFNEALCFEPIVPVGCAHRTGGPLLEHTASFDSDFNPSTPPSVVSPKVNYAARFAAAFAEAFSEEDGIADVEPHPTADPTQQDHSYPTPVVHRPSVAPLSSPTRQPPPPNLITSAETHPAQRDDDNNTDDGFRTGDIPNTTQLRSSSHPNQIKSPQRATTVYVDAEPKTMATAKEFASEEMRQPYDAARPTAIDNQFHHITSHADGSPPPAGVGKLSWAAGGLIVHAANVVASQTESTARANTRIMTMTSNSMKTTSTTRTVYVMDI